MANYEVIIDVGSKYVSAVLKQDDVLIKLPSVVACANDDVKQVVAVGVEALNLAKHGDKVKLCYPVMEGVVIDHDGAKALFQTLLDRVLPSHASFFNKLTVKCIMHCGAISADKKTVESILLSLGARQVDFVETPLADSVQLFNEFRTQQGIIVNIGSDCTDLAVVYTDNIVSGCTLYYSGKHLTQAIADKIRSKYNLQLSEEQAEILKINCASLYSNDTTVCTVIGYNVQTGNAEKVSVTSRELYDTLVDFFKKYCVVINSLLTSCPDNIRELARKQGVMLCGGGAEVGGLDTFLYGELNMPVRIANDPSNTSINGAINL